MQKQTKTKKASKLKFWATFEFLIIIYEVGHGFHQSRSLRQKNIILTEIVVHLRAKVEILAD